MKGENEGERRKEEMSLHKGGKAKDERRALRKTKASSMKRTVRPSRTATATQRSLGEEVQDYEKDHLSRIVVPLFLFLSSFLSSFLLFSFFP